MPGSFFDSNVLLYFVSDDISKSELAKARVRQGGMVSVQVLTEVANVARRKMRMSWQETHEVLFVFRGLLQAIPVDLSVHELGLSLAERHSLSIYDSMIVAAALGSGCETLYSEDMHHGMLVDGRLTIVNPFL